MTKDVNETVFSALPFLQKNSSFDFASIPFLLKKIQGAQFILNFFLSNDNIFAYLLVCTVVFIVLNADGVIHK